MDKASVSTLLLRPVLAALPEAEHARFFRATDLTPEQIADADARVSAPQFCIAWAELTRAMGSEVALEMAERAPVGAFGVVEYVCRTATTLGESLRQWVRYLNLLDDAVEVELVVEDHQGDSSGSRERSAGAGIPRAVLCAPGSTRS